jgi:hypothetical protein
LSFIKEKGLNLREVKIVSGGADGADTLGEEFAKKYKMKLCRKKANWNKYGRAAGPIRNKEMAVYAKGGGCICFWDGESSGTANMIWNSNQEQYDLDSKVVYYEKKG